MGMFRAVQAAVLAAVAVSGGFTWTVGQSGLTQTNKNLCELWASLPLPSYERCEFQNVLVIAWGIVSLVAAVWLIYESYKFLSNLISGKKKLLLPVLSTIVLSFALVGSVFWLISTYRAQSSEWGKPQVANKQIALWFPGEANADHKESLFKRSWSPFATNRKVSNISFVSLYIGVQNKSKEKTLKNVRLVVETLEGPGGRVLNYSAKSDATGKDTVDLPPDKLEYFYIGEGIDESEGGKFHPRIVDPAAYDQLVARAEQAKAQHEGFNLLNYDGKGIRLLKNDGYKLDITVYADDTPPLKAKMKLNAKTRIELYLARP